LAHSWAGFDLSQAVGHKNAVFLSTLLGNLGAERLEQRRNVQDFPLVYTFVD
jgi:hypothetical protein